MSRVKSLALALNHTMFVSSLLLYILTFCLSFAHGAASSPGGGHTNSSSKSLTYVKLYCLTIIFFATFLGGISPCFIKWNDGLLVLGTQFGGGVFLGTALTHFLSDANATFQKKITDAYPFAFVLACVGYLLTMLADCIVHWMLARKARTALPPKVDVEMAPKGARQVAGEGEEIKASKPDGDNEDGARGTEGDVGSSMQLQATEELTTAGKSAASAAAETTVLVMALCFHSVFEGMAVGVAEGAADAWRTLGAISVHQVLGAVAMAMALLRRRSTKRRNVVVAFAFLYAMSVPAGVAVGLVLGSTTTGPAAVWTHAVSMSIACGVFIYVAIHHLLAAGLTTARLDGPPYRFLAASLGVAVSALLVIWD